MRISLHRHKRRFRKRGAQWLRMHRSPGRRSISQVTIWTGGEPEAALCLTKPIAPPNPLCFEKNREMSVQIFDNFRRESEWAISHNLPFIMRSSPKKMPRIDSYLDFSQLSAISTSAAVVLASEYERVAALQGNVPPTVDLHKWQEPVFRKLFEIGFFEIVGLADTGRDLIEDVGDTRTMRIVSSKSADKLGVIDLALQELAQFLRPSQALPDEVDEIIIQFVTAISEAISNVTAHAYMHGIELSHRHINGVWVAATANRSDDSLTIVVYDQGASIPATYPRMERLDKVTRYLSRVVRWNPDQHDYAHDGTFIRAAMRYGGSRTDDSYRGKGLPQMFDALRRMSRGTMTILSRGGWCQRDAQTGRIRSGHLNSSIGGTLIEWQVSLS